MRFKNDSCFKKDYRSNTKVDICNSTYDEESPAIERLKIIYRTARKGRLSYKAAKNLWDKFFKKLHLKSTKLPSNFDRFAENKIRDLSRHLRELKLGDFGIAQKMFNLFMKDHWALNMLPGKTVMALHLPLDRALLSKLAEAPKEWKAWTKVKNTKPAQSEYLRIQKKFKNYWRRMKRFSSPIEMEQCLWHKI